MEPRWSAVWENQRRFGDNFLSTLISGDPLPFSNSDGTKPRDLGTLRPQTGWQWGSEVWRVDISDITDKEGWSYSSDWNGNWSAHVGEGTKVRRRRHVRPQVRDSSAPRPYHFLGDAHSDSASHANFDASPARDVRASFARPQFPATPVPHDLVGLSDRASVFMELPSAAASAVSGRASTLHPMMSSTSSANENSRSSLALNAPLTRLISTSSYAEFGAFDAEDEWWHDAAFSGAWVIDLSRALFAGYLRGPHVRWRRDTAAEAIPMDCVESSPSGATWAVAKSKCVFVRTVRPDEEPRPQTVEHIFYEYQRTKFFSGSSGAWADSTFSATPREASKKVFESSSDSLRDKARLPSNRWVWEADWAVHKDHPTQTDEDGWEYASDITGPFSNCKTPPDNVRRRKWVRRRYCSGSVVWLPMPLPADCQAASVSIGPGVVWVLTHHWQIFCRTGISETDCEGLEWNFIDGPNIGFERVSTGCVAVNQAGVVWLVAIDGTLYNRKGITPEKPLGTSWELIKSQLKIKHALLTNQAAYCVSMEGLVIVPLMDASSPAAWKLSSPPPENTACLVSVCVSTHAERLWAVDIEKRLFERKGASARDLAGSGWAPVSLSSRENVFVHSATTTGCSPLALLRLPSLKPGSWLSIIVDQLEERDQREKNHDLFGHFEKLLSPIPEVMSEKEGFLSVKLSGKDSKWSRRFAKFSANGGVIQFFPPSTSSTAAGLQANGEDPPGTVVLKLDQLVSVRGSADDQGEGGARSDDDGNIEGDGEVDYVFTLRSKQPDYDCVLVCASSQREKEQWVLSLLVAYSMWNGGGYTGNIKPATVPESSALWAIDTSGAPWFSNNGDLDTLLAWSSLPPFLLHPTWGRVQGRFVAISSANGVTWGLGNDGWAYALSMKQRQVVKEARDGPLGQRRSSDASIAGRPSISASSVSTTTEVSWIRVPAFRYFDKNGVMTKLVSISLVRGHAWAVNDMGQVLVRSSVFKDSPQGLHWHRVGKETDYTKVLARPQLVCVLNSKSTLHFRRGFSPEEPFGTHWVLDNGDIRSSLLPPLPNADKQIVPGPQPQQRFFTVGGSKQLGLCGITHDRAMKRGAVHPNGIVTWTSDQEADIKKISAQATGLLWGLTNTGHLKTLSQKKGIWEHKLSVSAHNPKSRIFFEHFASGSSIETDGRGHYMGDGSVMEPITGSEWALKFVHLLNDRDYRVEKSLAERGIKNRFSSLVEKISVGTKICMLRPDGFWYNGRVVGIKTIEDICVQTFYIIGLATGVHCWGLQKALVLDSAPPAETVFPRRRVLGLVQSSLVAATNLTNSWYEPGTVESIDDNARVTFRPDSGGVVRVCGVAELRPLIEITANNL